NGEMATEQRPVERMSEKYPLLKLPILRGLGTIGQAIGLGVKALKFSANAALDDGTDPNQKPVEIPAWMMTTQVVVMLAVFLAVFKWVPLELATKIGARVPSLNGIYANNFLDGAIRAVILLAYLFLLSRLKDIQRVFQYHGAEHKVVFNFESGKPVNVENAQAFQTFHPRCGTNFLAVIVGVSFLVYPLIPVHGFAARLLIRIALLPLIAGLSYEVIRFAAKRPGTLFALVSKPGLWLQRITTKQPDDSQAAVAIHALEGAMALEEKQGGELVIA
ncbi:MAG TPA: DUF1385 domain-containing protein, partial [Bryobacteraceae bacterium]|nr:DUF1385 domain-containing protein [Bryobacteraceae bacterium]